MSKAFTRESDDPVEEAVVLPRTPLPPGVKNYITPAGAERLRSELVALSEAKAASGGQANEARIRQLKEIIASLVIAEPPVDREVIRFGASVTVRRGAVEESFRLVGVDETNLDRNEISWLSPLARALIGHRAGDRVRFRSPSGPEELVIASVSYA